VTALKVPLTVALAPDAVPQKLKNTDFEPPTTAALSSAFSQLNPYYSSHSQRAVKYKKILLNKLPHLRRSTMFIIARR
jgi:hypothetical protein